MIKKLLFLIVVLCLLFPIVMADSSFSDTFEFVNYPFATAFTGGSSVPSLVNAPLNITVHRGLNSSGLTEIIGESTAWGGTGAGTSFPGSHNTAIQIRVASTNELVGEGTLKLDYLAGLGDAQTYTTTISLTSWNITPLTTSPMYLKTVYTEADIHNLKLSYVDGDGIVIPPVSSMPSAILLSSKSGANIREAFCYDTNIFILNFRNIVSTTKSSTTGKITYTINKNTGINGYSGITLITGGTTVLNNIFGSSDIDSYTYAAPLSITITENSLGRSMRYVYFDNIYNFTLSTSQTQQNIPVTGNLRSSSGAMPSTSTAVSYSYIDSSNNELIFKENFAATNRTMDFILKSGTWYGWDSYFSDYVNNKGATMPVSPVLYFPDAGNFTTRATFYRTDVGTTIVEGSSITVLSTGGGSSAYTTVLAVNAFSGSIISNANIFVKDLTKNQWFNLTGNPVVIPSSSGFSNIYTTASNYYPTTNLGMELGEPHTIAMFPITSTSDPLNDTQLNVLVINGLTGDVPINEAYVSIGYTNGTTVKSDYTNIAGSVSFTVQNGSVIESIASKSGFVDVSSINTVTGTNYLVVLRMQSSVIVPTYTTAIPTGLITIAPTVTGIGGIVINQTPDICGAPTTNIVQGFKNNIACFGVSDKTSQNLAFAGIIIAFFAFVMSKWGKALGALIGAAIGFILSLAANLIPIWVFFALVIIAGLIFGLKLYGDGK